MKNIIEMTGVSRSFGSIQALRQITLSIPAGCFFTLVGPNGAGKTTLFRILTASIAPDRGRIFIDGIPLDRRLSSLKRRIGMVGQHGSLGTEMTAWENLELHGRLFGLKTAERKKRIDEAFAFTGLNAHRDRLAKQMSGGMRRRLMIARSLLHRPSILFMDEPTVGLDPASRRDIWDVLMDLREQGLSIFMTTHYLEEADRLSHRVALIHNGEIVACGSPRELKESVGTVVLERFENGKTTFAYFQDPEEAQQSALRGANAPVIREISLEDVFLKLMSDRGKEVSS